MRQSLPAGNIQQALSRNKDTTATAQLKGVIPDFYPSQAEPILSKGPSSSTSTPLRPNPSHKSMPTVTVLIQTPHRSLWRLCPTGFLAFCPHLFNSQGENHGIPEPSWCAWGLATSPWYPITCKSEGIMLLKSPVFALSFSFSLKLGSGISSFPI